MIVETTEYRRSKAKNEGWWCARFSPTCNHHLRGKSVRSRCDDARRGHARISLADKGSSLNAPTRGWKVRPSRARTTALRLYRPPRRAAPSSRGRTRREEEEQRGKNYTVKKGRCARKHQMEPGRIRVKTETETSERRMDDRNEDFNWYRDPHRPPESFLFSRLPKNDLGICLLFFGNNLPKLQHNIMTFTEIIHLKYTKNFTEIYTKITLHVKKK